jgi:hypothetical protein
VHKSVPASHRLLAGSLFRHCFRYRDAHERLPSLLPEPTAIAVLRLLGEHYENVDSPKTKEPPHLGYSKLHHLFALITSASSHSIRNTFLLMAPLYTTPDILQRYMIKFLCKELPSNPFERESDINLKNTVFASLQYWILEHPEDFQSELSFIIMDSLYRYPCSPTWNRLYMDVLIDLRRKALR